MDKRKLKVLAIDDHADNLLVLKAVVADALPEATVFTAASGLQGLDLAAVEDPDVILLDVIMPGMDGFEVCRRLKADARLQAIPVIFLTAQKTDRESRIQALEVGAEGFLSKPLNEPELIAQIRAMAKVKAGNQLLRLEKRQLAEVATERTRQLEQELAERRKTETDLQRANAELEQSQLSILNLLEDQRQVEVALRESHATAQAILSASTESVFLMDLQGTVITANATTAQRLGVTLPELIGKDIFALLPAELKEARLERLATVIREGRPLHFEDQRAGLWLSHSFYPVLGSAGKVERVAVFSQDITQRKQSEETLRRAHVRYQALVENAPDAVVLVSAAGQFKYVSSSALRIMGYQLADIEQASPNALTHPEDLPQVLSTLQALMTRPAGPVTLQYRFRHADGTYRWVESTFSNLLAEPGLEAIVINFRDVTERRQSETALRASEARFREVSAAITNIAYSCRRLPDGSFGLDWITGPSQATLGYTPAELHALGCWGPFVVESDRPLFQQQVVGLAPGASGDCELRLQRRDGSLVWVASYARMVAGAGDAAEPVLYGALVDISQRKQAAEELRAAQEETARLLTQTLASRQVLLSVVEDQKKTEAELRATEERLRRAVVESPFPIMLHAEDGVILQTSRSWLELSGYTAAELATLSDWTEHAYGHRLALGPADFDLLYGHDQRKHEGDTPIRTKDGARRIWDFSSAPLGKLPDGRRVVITMAMDVTERRANEAALRASEERLRAATEAARIGTWERHPTTGALAWSPMLEELMGYAPGTFPGTEAAFLELLHPDSRVEYASALERGLYGDGVVHAELRFQLRDGRERWGLLHGRLLRDAAGQPERLAGVDVDLTERKLMEQRNKHIEAQMQQQQKLESIGTLASGVAHEINNPINGVMNYAQLIMDQSPGNTDVGGYAAEIIHETKRVATIVSNLLQFARQEKQSHSPGRMYDIIAATLSLVRIIIKRDQIDLQVQVPEDLPLLKCRSQQVQQVIMNLLTNARDALNARYHGYDADKVIELTAGVLEIEQRRWVRVTVADRGTGIPVEVQEKIFDPFFTTKSRTQGTGLGLAISHGIVRDHHGKLHFETVPGAGTRFHLDLPLDNGWELEPAPAFAAAPQLD